MSSLLIMSCSKTKKRLENVSAIDLYDGQAYRVIRKRSTKNLEILIISAKYGIIRYTDIVSYYDQVMTVTEAVKMKEHVEKVIRKTVWKRNSMRIFINLGFPYNLAVSEELIDFLDEGFNLQVASGPIGKRAHQLKEWLEAGK